MMSTNCSRIITNSYINIVNNSPKKTFIPGSSFLTWPSPAVSNVTLRGLTGGAAARVEERVTHSFIILLASLQCVTF